MIPVALPSWMKQLGTRMAKESGIFGGEEPNHVLVNEYLGAGGIMPHEDGPLYKPHFAILSLESALIMDIYKKEESGHTLSFRILLEPRSLLVFKDQLYTDYLHGIAFSDRDVVDEKVVNLDSTSYKIGDEIERKKRLSLTIRVVTKTLKNVIKLR
eukprot:TRINITY_DN2741_c0_g1_i1.p1 TRINITY_DN2741_c0_g1~~TRINITY_DN2741_c0_g1_i1.p1  ORF type:complete len:156 (-),score=40.81 TRINITY_DN2741_c0_g1_i1:26-493(-)